MIRLALRIAGVLEAVSLLALVSNLAFIHQQPFAAALGPIHGIIYVIVVVLSFLTPLPIRNRLFGLIPGIGGLLVVRAVRGAQTTRPPADYW
jgi:hypothetical protein